MNIIADFVPNHCSIKHPYFIDAYNKKNSKYKNWFYFTKWPDKYKSFLSFNEIPKLNLENDETREHIVQAAKYWLSFGFDGFRLDHVIGPSHQFWIYFVREIKKLYPSIILIGEAWMQGLRFHDLNTIKLKVKYLKWIRGNASDYLLKSYQGILDGVLDFHGQQIIHKYGFYYDYQINNIINLLNKHYKRFHSTFILPLFLDNHDMDRILFACNNDKNFLKKLSKVQFSVNQPIIIYYGTEIGMTQQRSVWNSISYGDIEARQPMQWNHIDTEILLFYQQLCHQRKKRINFI
jgi:glycosidase